MDHLIHLLAAVLVPLFFIGMAGSMLVVLVTVARDLQQVFTSDEESSQEPH
ncbi:hypothetical protein [Edaphobacter aggregans]|uniref:hypothetical protein n=1 Tax=Edaphobacter aggregans TaxID=570835 RepID=UPI0012FC05AE|nr:hypothetical protein [Edaphobacter aggregans]